MFIRLLFLFTVVPVVEIYLLIRIGSVIGAFPTILLIMTTGVLGAYFARREGFMVLQTIQQQMARGEIPASAMIDGLCVLVAGLVLITPGVLTDILGFLLLVPASREVLKRLMVRYFRDAVARGSVQVSGSMFQQQQQFHASRENERERPVRDGEAVFIKPEDTPDSRGNREEP